VRQAGLGGRPDQDQAIAAAERRPAGGAKKHNM